MVATQRLALRSTLLAVLFGAGLMAGWSALLVHNLARVERLTDVVREQSQRNLLMLSADSLEYRDYFARFPTSLAAMTTGNSLVEFHKRPLYGPVSATLTVVLAKVGLVYPSSLYVILSLYASLAVLLAFRLFRTTGLTPLDAGLLAASCGVSFSWLAVFSMPESYSLTTCGALLAMLSGARLPHLNLDDPGSARVCLRHAVVTGIAAWLYLPIAGAVLLLLPTLRSRRDWLTAALPTGAVAAAVAIAPQFLFGFVTVQQQLVYGDRWSTLLNFGQGRLLAEVAGAFLWFGFVAPVPDYLYAPAELNLAVLRPGSWTMVCATFFSALLASLWFGPRVNVTVRRVSGAACWFAALYAFHVYFNPSEVLLYLSVPVAVLAYSTALAMSAGGPSPSRSRRSTGALVVLVALLALANYRAVIGS